MPYKKEHACRLANPEDFEGFTRKNCAIKKDEKCIDVIYGIKGSESEIQAFRYPVEEWGEEEAFQHCKEHNGIFEAAFTEEMTFKNLEPEAARNLFKAEKRVAYIPIRNFEWKESQSGDGTRILRGYAAVYDKITVLYKSEGYVLKERIAKGAFDKVLSTNPDVHLVAFEHLPCGVPIARTRIKSGPGTLQLESDDFGLKVYAKLNPYDPDVVRLASKMDYGIIDKMSFSFRVGKDRIETEEVEGKIIELREIIEIDELFDVAVLAQGAYAETAAILRCGACVTNRKVTEEEDGACVTNRKVTEEEDGACVTNRKVTSDSSSAEKVACQKLALLTRAKLILKEVK